MSGGQTAFAQRGPRETLPVSRPSDPAEREAESAADAVVTGGTVAGWSFSAPPPGSPGEVQRSAGSSAATPAVLGDGLAGPGRPLDAVTRGAMGARFGYDFSSVRVHDDGRAAAAASRLDAEAFTIGDRVGFASRRFDPASPAGGRLLANELAHVVQQGRNPAASGIVHRYTAYSAAQQTAGASRGWTHPGGDDIRISDDGQMAVEDKGWHPGSNKRAWTTPALVATANSVLRAQGSHANLRPKPGSTPIGGAAPATGAASSLVEIEPYRPSGGVFTLIGDCGDACRQVMGSGGRDVAALTRPPDPGSAGVGGGIAGAILGGLAGVAAGIGIGLLVGGLAGAVVGGLASLALGALGTWSGYKAGRALARRDPQPAREEYLSPRTYHARERDRPSETTGTPEEWTEELIQRELGGWSRADAYQRYANLSPAERDAFDREHGINKYAQPRVGQGQTIGTEYDMPGYHDIPGVRTWNFHYAATVLTSGDDHVTLESARNWAPTAWIFYLYGPHRKAQSFHEEHGAMQSHGTHYTTFVVQPEATLNVRTIRATDLLVGGRAVSLPAGTALRVVQRRPGGGAGDLRLFVRVASGPHADETGTVRASDVR